MLVGINVARRFCRNWKNMNILVNMKKDLTEMKNLAHSANEVSVVKMEPKISHLNSLLQVVKFVWNNDRKCPLEFLDKMVSEYEKNEPSAKFSTHSANFYHKNQSNGRNFQKQLLFENWYLRPCCKQRNVKFWWKTTFKIEKNQKKKQLLAISTLQIFNARNRRQKFISEKLFTKGSLLVLISLKELSF